MEGFGADFLSFRTTLSFFSAVMASFITSLSMRPFLVDAGGAVARQLHLYIRYVNCLRRRSWSRMCIHMFVGEGGHVGAP